MKRNSAIDYLKFLFSLMIFLYHFDLGFYGGYIVVEGFFMISGYLMFLSLQKKKELSELPDGTARFVWNKYKALFLPLLFSAISGFLIQELLVFGPMEKESLWDIPLLIFEVFPLQSAGFKGRWTTGVSWYVSATLIAVALLHPFFKKKPEHAAYTLCPILSLLVWGLLNVTYGHLGVTTKWIVGLFHGGVLRAIAGISAGFFLGALLMRTKEWRPVLRTRILLSVAELGGLVFLIYVTCLEEFSYSAYDLVLTALQFGILWIALSGKAWHTPHVSFKHSKIFSTMSLYIFLNHVAWCMYFQDRHSTVGEGLRVLPIALLCVASSGAVVWGLTTLTQHLWKKATERQTLALKENE